MEEKLAMPESSRSRGNEFAKQIIKLLSEYERKLVGWQNQIKQLHKQITAPLPTSPKNVSGNVAHVRRTEATYHQANLERRVLKVELMAQVKAFDNMTSKLNKLGSSASQHVEHGSGDDIVLIELSIRLSEFERQLAITTAIVFETMHISEF